MQPGYTHAWELPASPALRGLWGAWWRGNLWLPSGLAWSHGCARWGACRSSGWQHRSQEISSLLILIACDGREIYGSELRFVRGSNTPY